MRPAAEDLAALLAARAPVEAPAVLVVAHPDDETLALGPLLPLFRNLTLIHVTDGAPRDLRDARAHGFPSAAAYAAAREAELTRALELLGATPARIGLGLPDQQAVHHLPAIVTRLAPLLAGAVHILTHPYEGGHPDHDAAALAVARALPPGSLRHHECAFYHAAPGGGARWGTFHPDPSAPETLLPLSPAERATLAHAADAFATQSATLRPNLPAALRVRPAPAYDFSAPPPPGRCLWEDWGFPLTGADWRAAALRSAR